MYLEHQIKKYEKEEKKRYTDVPNRWLFEKEEKKKYTDMPRTLPMIKTIKKIYKQILVNKRI